MGGANCSSPYLVAFTTAAKGHTPFWSLVTQVLPFGGTRVPLGQGQGPGGGVETTANAPPFIA